MSIDDAQTSLTQPDDHCLVHHFIRTHGRRPTADELAGITATVVVPPAPRSATEMPAPSLVHTMRREVARLVNRL
jgi:hypothetical protein